MLFHPFLGFATRIRSRQESAEVQAKVAESLSLGRRRATWRKLGEYFEANATPEQFSRVASASAEQFGDGTILQMLIDFVNAHWEDILKIILSLIGGAMAAAAVGSFDVAAERLALASSLLKLIELILGGGLGLGVGGSFGMFDAP